MEDNKYLEIIKQFVDGKVNIKDFERICKESEPFRGFIKDFEDYKLSKYNDSMLTFVDSVKWDNIDVQMDVFLVFRRFVISRGYEDYEGTDFYIKQCQNFYAVVPDWLNDSAVEWVDANILSKVPEGLNKAQRKKWVKEQVEKTFPCEKRHPSWIQGTEDWPQDEDGNFLTFVKQKEKGEEVTYTFVNKKTKEEVEVKEYY